MISLKKVKKFCKDYTQIENYDKAVNEAAKSRWTAKRLEKNTLQDTV